MNWGRAFEASLPSLPRGHRRTLNDRHFPARYARDLVG